MKAPTIPALALTMVLGVVAAVGSPGPSPHSSHHPAEQSGTERALGRVAAALAQRLGYPR